MKIIVGFLLVVLAFFFGSDFNPLLMWEPYQKWISSLLISSPKLFTIIFLGMFIVGYLLIVCGMVFIKKSKKTPETKNTADERRLSHTVADRHNRQ